MADEQEQEGGFKSEAVGRELLLLSDKGVFDFEGERRGKTAAFWRSYIHRGANDAGTTDNRIQITPKSHRTTATEDPQPPKRDKNPFHQNPVNRINTTFVGFLKIKS